MKTIKILGAVALMSVSGISIAQDRDTDQRESFRFGIKAGLNHSNVYDVKAEEFEADPKFGFAGGFMLCIPLNTYLGVQPEILLSQKGFKGEGTLFGSPYKFTRTTTYLDIPLQIAFKPSEYITVLAGPQYSYLLKQNDEFSSEFIDYSQEQEFENENIRKNIFGFVMGMDIMVAKFVLGARAGWDIQHNHGDGTSSTPRYKNVWFQGTLGFNF